MPGKLQLTGTPKVNKLSGVSGDLLLIKTSPELHNQMRLGLVLGSRGGESTSPPRPALNCLQPYRDKMLTSQMIHLLPPKSHCNDGPKSLPVPPYNGIC